MMMVVVVVVVVGVVVVGVGVVGLLVVVGVVLGWRWWCTIHANFIIQPDLI
jgi:hypothetical protein